MKRCFITGWLVVLLVLLCACGSAVPAPGQLPASGSLMRPYVVEAMNTGTCTLWQLSIDGRSSVSRCLRMPDLHVGDYILLSHAEYEIELINGKMHTAFLSIIQRCSISNC